MAEVEQGQVGEVEVEQVMVGSVEVEQVEQAEQAEHVEVQAAEVVQGEGEARPEADLVAMRPPAAT